ncbi:MAG TPA: Calx-beta domain-containing protein, partial [Thermoanaerobaculia bacterium]|nr:Calx-beta domain-containing protein [Thermoanaerobaculia bacterium]
KTDALADDLDGDGMPSPGDVIAYTIAVHNGGNTSATGVRLLDEVPAHATLVAGSVTTTLGSVVSELPVDVAIGELAADGEAVVTFRVAVDDPLPAGVRQLVNQGRVESAQLAALLTDDPDVGGAADPTVTPLVAASVLVVTKRDLLASDADGDGVPSAGDQLLYQLRIDNTGNTAGSALLLEDPLPAQTALVAGSLQTSQGVATPGDPVRVSLGALPAGAVATVSFRVEIADPFGGAVSIANQATVTSAELPPVPSDDPDTPELGDPTSTGIGNLIFRDGFESGDLLRWSGRSNGSGNGAGAAVAASGARARAIADVGSMDSVEPTGALPTDVAVPAGERRSGESRRLPRISIADVETGEGGEARFVVSLDAPSERTVAVDFATTDGSAVAGEDYRTAAGRIVFAPGATERTVAVALVDDGILEPAVERFTARLSHPVGGVLADGVGEAAIRDDELCAGPNLFAGGAAREQEVDLSPFAESIDGEGQSFALELFITASGAAPNAEAQVSVEYLDSAGAVLDRWDTGIDRAVRGRQHVRDVHAAPAGARRARLRLVVEGASGAADVRFEAISFRPLRMAVLTLADAAVSEGRAGKESAATFRFTASCPYFHDVALEYATADGTATATDDYRSTSGTVELSAGDVEAAVSVPVRGDDRDEAHETFRLESREVGNSGAVLLRPAAGAVIANDDFCPRTPSQWLADRSGWPAERLTVGKAELDARELVDVLSSAGDDVASLLARQVIAVKLDLLAGSDPAIAATVEEADMLLTAHPPGSDPRAAAAERARALATRLSEYNGHCERAVDGQ